MRMSNCVSPNYFTKPNFSASSPKALRPEIHRPASRKPPPTSTPPERTRYSPTLLISVGTSPGRGFRAPRPQHPSPARPPEPPTSRYTTTCADLADHPGAGSYNITIHRAAGPENLIDPRRVFGKPTATLCRRSDGRAIPDPKGTGASRARPKAKRPHDRVLWSMFEPMRPGATGYGGLLHANRNL